MICKVDIPYSSVEMALEAKKAQQLARALGDRQNSESTLSPSLCTQIVNSALNFGNIFEALAKQMAAAEQESKCQTPSDPLPISTTLPS